MPPRNKYKVTGINPKSGQIKSVTVAASSAEEAKTIAGEKGLRIITSVKDVTESKSVAVIGNE